MGELCRYLVLGFKMRALQGMLQVTVVSQRRSQGCSVLFHMMGEERGG